MYNYLKDWLSYLFNQNMNVIYFDFETTGLNPYHDKIIDFCFLKEPKCSPESNETFLQTSTSSNDYFHIDENYFESLVNPKKKLVSKITEITGLTDDMLVNKPSIDHFLPTIETYINKDATSCYLIAHNCHGFDQLFLDRAFKDNDSNIHLHSWKFIDTLLLAKRVNPKMFSYSLKTLCKYYKIEEGKHRALSDCIALRKVYIKLLEKLNRDYFKNTYKIDELIKNPNIVYDFLYYN